MRTLNEAIAQEIELYEIAKDRYKTLGLENCKRSAEEHKQYAAWLEELKCYRNDNDFSDYADRLHKIAFNSGYNKAIDDFVEKVSLEISENIIWEMLVDSHKDNSFADISDKIVNYVIKISKNVAEQLKEESRRLPENQNGKRKESNHGDNNIKTTHEKSQSNTNR